MAFTEQVRIVIDFVTKKSGSALGDIRSDVAQAEGAMGKLKAGVGGVASAVGSIGPQFAAAVGVAVAGFVAKATGEFEKLALAADKFSKSSGLAVDEASRWIEVAGDVGVETGTLESAFNKLAVTVDKSPDSLAKWGVEVQKAKDGSVDMNATILNVIGALDKLDPAKRAAAMKEIFGKGAVGGAQLFSLSVDDISKRLAEVSEAKVIDPEEEAKAERLRDAVDSLKDAWDNVVLTVGEVGAGLAPALDFVGKLVGKVTELDGTLQKITGGFSIFTGGLGFIAQAWDGITGHSKSSADGQKQALADVAAAAGETTSAVDEIGAAYDELLGKLTAEKRDLAIKDSFDEARDAAVKAWDAAVAGANNATGAQRNARQSIVDLKIDVAKYAEEVLKLPPDKVTKILADIDNGSLADAEKDLDALTKTRNATVLVHTVLQNALSFLPGVKPAGTAASASTASSRALAGQLAAVPTAVPVVASTPITVNVNLPPGSDSDSRVVGAVQRWARRNGSH